MVEWRGLKRSSLEGNLKVFKFGRDNWERGGMAFHNLCGMAEPCEHLSGYTNDVTYFERDRSSHHENYSIHHPTMLSPVQGSERRQ